MTRNEIIKQIGLESGLVTTENIAGLNRQLLADKINELLNNDFQKLVSILYRMDISEAKLKLLLKDNPGYDAAIIIADLMIERQAEKINSRKETKSNNEIPDDEKW